MPGLITAKEPFRFYTRLCLSELTGLRAANLGQLLQLVSRAPDSCIYNHTYNFLREHHYLSPEPPNDFAYWVTAILKEKKLGAELSSIDTIKYSSIDSLRRKIVATIGDFLKKNPWAYLNFAQEGEEFHFIKSVSYAIPTDYMARDLNEFSCLLEKVTTNSIYFHIFEARLRLSKKTNDFSIWIESSVGDKELADRISGLNPYRYNLEEVRMMVIGAIRERILEYYD